MIREPGFYARVDLADDELEIVIEADSFEFHSSPSVEPEAGHGLGAWGWLVLRLQPGSR